MRILAIDSSGLVATVAVVEEENEISKTIAEYTINYKKTHSQTLLPMLDEIVKMTDMNLDTIDAIAIIYRTQNWFSNCKGTGTGTEEAFDSHSDSRRTCL